MARMSDAELVAAIEAREQNSYGFGSGDLADQRAEAIRRFTGEPLGNEQEGRSQVVPTSMRETYLWIAPQLLRVFLGTDEVVRFEARSPEDEASAQQETEVINYVATTQNAAFVNFSAWMQDAMLGGAGYVKVWWHADESVQVEKYFGKGEDEVAMLLQDPEVEVAEQRAYPDPDWVPMPPQVDPQTGQPMPEQPQPTLYDLVLRRKVADEYARYEAVPPEELYVSKHARSVSLQDVDFVEHRRRVTLSELRSMGYDVPDDISGWYDRDGWDEDGVKQARDRWSEDDDFDSDEPDPSMRRVTYREAYCLLDYNGDGKAERRKVCVVGAKVLNNEEVDCVPFAVISPILFAHRHIGLSLYDLLREIEEIRISLTRSYLDGIYQSLRPRTAIDANSVNMDDLLTSMPGGIVRTIGSPGDKVMPLPVSDIGPIALQGLQWLDQWKQDASGVSPYFQGGQSLDAAALNKTATGVSQLISQAQMRVEAIARAFADTGVRDLFLLLHQLTLKHARKALTIKLRNQWTTVDPREWKKRTNLVVTVALGAGTKEMRAQQLQGLIALQMQVAPLGLATPDKLYNSISRLCNELGYRNPDEFVANPAMQPPPAPPPPDPLVQAQQIKSRTDLQIKQIESQAEQVKVQQDAQLEQAKMTTQAQIDQYNAQQQAEIEREKAQVQAQTQIAVARVKAELEMQTQIEIERMRLGMPAKEAEFQQEKEMQAEQVNQIVAAIQQLQQMVQAVGQDVARMQQPKQIVRDQRGRVIGAAGPDGQLVHQVVRDAAGKVAGVVPASTRVQ